MTLRQLKRRAVGVVGAFIYTAAQDENASR